MSQLPVIAIPIVAGIGNAIMTEPMVRQLRAALPTAQVKIIAMTSAMGEVFRRIPGVDVAVSGRGSWKIFRSLRESGPIDTLIVPFPSNRWQYNVLAKRSGARRVLMHSYPPEHRAWLSGVGQRVEAVRGIHDVMQNLRLLEKLGVHARLDDAPQFAVTDEDRLLADQWLIEHSDLVQKDTFIAMHAGSAGTVLAAAKRWPPTRYGQVARALWNVPFQLPTLVLEGPDEIGIASQIRSGHPGGADRVAHTDFRMSGGSVRLAGPLGIAAAILERAQIYVGTDSGLAHLAAAVGTRAVTLFAPADPSRVCPFGNDDLVVTPNKTCSPCFLYPWESSKPKMRCRPPYCIEEISVEMVMEKVRLALSTSRGATKAGSPERSLRADQQETIRPGGAAGSS